MSSGHEGDDELFARAWDEREAADRAGQQPRRPQDPVLAADLDLASALRDAVRAVPGPDHDARARMRAGLMAEIAPPSRPGVRQDTRTLRRSSRSARAAGSRASRPADSRPAARPAGRAGRRLLANVVTGACAVLLLAALTVLMSRGSLPGETLYGVKRASENVELGLTTGQEQKGLKHLEFATSRLEEVSGLIARDTTTAAGAGPVAAGLDPTTAGHVLDNLRSFDQDARTGSRMILPLASQAGPSGVDLGGWARAQSARLDTLSPSLPDDGRIAAASSQEMLQRLSARADALGGSDPCATGASADDLGPLPVDGCSATSAPGPALAPSEPESTSTSSETSTTTSTTTSSTTTSSAEDTPASDGDVPESGPRSSGGTTGPTEEQPAPVQVPMPVPLLPQVDLPPLLPGLPGLSLG